MDYIVYVKQDSYMYCDILGKNLEYWRREVYEKIVLQHCVLAIDVHNCINCLCRGVCA